MVLEEVRVPDHYARRIVIVSDDGEFRDELSQTLGDVFAAATESAGSATQELFRRRVPPAAIVLDLDAEGGFGLLGELGAHATLARVPIIALSSNGDFATLQRAHQLDVAEFMTKPLLPETLRERLLAITTHTADRASGSRLKLGTMLVASGLLTAAQIEDALARQPATGARLGEVLVREGLITEQEIVGAVAEQMRIGVIDLNRTSPHTNATGLLPRDFIVRHRVLPVRLREDGSLELAMTNPLDVITLDEVGMLAKRRVVPLICTQSAFDEAVAVYFSSRGKLKDARDDEIDALSPPSSDIDASVIEIVDALLTDATSVRASDIHIEPREDTLHVRCRIDGVLHPMRDFPKDLQAGIISRLKIMANINIAERRLPQDGRTSFELSSGEAVDLRLASFPSLHGENIAIRILEVTPLPPTLSSLGLNGENLARFETALRKAEGGVAIVGPTGSGKSTTLYTTLELIRTPERKVYTVEDPIERKINGIIQTEVKPHIGLTFAQALRSLVRADPDIIMVGEIRDLETAKMAADSAVTGHKVFTTLHTNDASSAVMRLVEMGVPRYLVAAAWDCFVAQRLTRRLCAHCRAAESVTDVRWRELGLGEPPGESQTVYNPVGCGKCFGTGYRGRIGLYEVLLIDDDLRELVASSGTVLDIQRMARAKGVGSLRDDGVRKVLDGSTSYLELLRVTS